MAAPQTFLKRNVALRNDEKVSEEFIKSRARTSVFCDVRFR